MVSIIGITPLVVLGRRVSVGRNKAQYGAVQEKAM